MPPARGSVLARLRAGGAVRQPARRIWSQQAAADHEPGLLLPLPEFFRGAWRQFNPAPLVWGRHIDAQCEHAEAVTRGEIRRLLVSVPPGSIKSILWAVIWQAWVWTRQPSFQWFIISVNEMAGGRDARRTRELIGSEWYRSNWGRRVRIDPSERATEDIGLLAGGKRYFKPMQGTITALRGDALVIDDPQAVKPTLYSSAYRTSTIEKVRSEALNRVNDKAKSPIVIVQQRIHEQDVTGQLLELGGWDHLCIPREYNNRARYVRCTGFVDWRMQPGELMDPERTGPAEVAEMRLHTRAYEAQENQNPQADAGAKIKREWLRRWTRERLPERWTSLITVWDLTMGKALRDVDRGEREGRRSFVVGQLWGAHLSSLYLLAQVRGEWEADLQLGIIGEFAQTLAPHGGTRHWPQYATTTCIEDAALGPTAASLVKAPGLTLVPTMGKSKRERLDDVLPVLGAKRVYVPDESEADWVKDFIDRITRFPSSTPDDEVDAISMALAQLANDPAADLREIHARG